MKLHGALSATMVLTTLFGLEARARAQGAPEPAPAAPEPAPAAAPTPAPEASSQAVVATPAPAHPTARDGTRLRGGFGINGGAFFLPNNPVGGAASVSGRVGVQFNHIFSLYYMQTPIVGANVAQGQRSATVIFADYNTLLFGVTAFHTLDIGIGPSLDYIAVAKGSLNDSNNIVGTSANVDTGTGWAGGGHARVAFVIGGLSGEGPRRSGFTIGVDAHPMFLSTGKALSLTAGIGAEWY